MPYHRLARLATSRLVLTGALTLANVVGVGTLQGSSEQTVYNVSSTSGLARLSADTVAARSQAAAEAEDGEEPSATAAETVEEDVLQVRAEPPGDRQEEWPRPKIRTAQKLGETATSESEQEAAETSGSPEPDVPEALQPAPLPPPPPPPEPVDSVWTSLAACESGGNWQIDTGNGYYGGLQFSLESWHAVGGHGYPHEHPRDVQIAMAERLQSLQGWDAWPNCSRHLGLI